MIDTIFSKIITREIPAHIVYEDEQVLAFLDIRPVNPGHTLIIPKQPFTNVFDGEEATLAHMIVVAKKIALAQKEALGVDGVNITMNNEAAAGQEVFHAHIHVIPRYTNDNKSIELKRSEEDDISFEVIAKKINSSLT